MPKKFVISNHIRRLRFFANEMTQQELAEKAGVSRQTIIAIEAGKYSPSLEMAFRIADAFGVTPLRHRKNASRIGAEQKLGRQGDTFVVCLMFAIVVRHASALFPAAVILAQTGPQAADGFIPARAASAQAAARGRSPPCSRRGRLRTYE